MYFNSARGMRTILFIMLSLVMAAVILPNALSSGIVLKDYAITVNFEDETLTLGTDIAAYSFTIGGDSVPASGAGVAITEEMFGRKLYFRDSENKNVKTYSIPKRPATPVVKVNYKNETIGGITDDMVIIGGDGILERISNKVYKINVPDEDTPVYVYRRATPKAFKSAQRGFLITKRPDAPDPGMFPFNAAKGRVMTGTKYQVSADGIEYKDAPAMGYKLGDLLDSGEEIQIYIRRKAITSREVAFASLPATYIVEAAPEGPTDIFFDARRDMITGINDSLEYKIDNNNWASFPKKLIEFSLERRITSAKPIQVMVRIKGAGTIDGTRASAAVGLIILPRAPAPAPGVDALTESLTGLGTEYEYRFGKTGAFTVCESDTVPIVTKEKVAHVRLSGTDAEFMPVTPGGTLNEVTPASSYKTIPVPTRYSRPSMKKDMSKMQITKILKGMQYRILISENEEDDLWIDVEQDDVRTGVMDITEAMLGRTVQFRMGPEILRNTKLASLPANVFMAAMPDAPERIYLHYASETILGLSPAMEYRYALSGTIAEDAEWTKIKGKTINITKWLDEIDGDIDFEVRVASTKLRPQGAPSILLIEGREEFPSDDVIELDIEKEIIDGITTSCQYSIDGGRTWRAATNDMSVSALIPPTNAAAVDMQLRVKPNTHEVGTRSKIITLLPRTKTPNVKVDYFNELLDWVGKDDQSVKLQYRYGTSGDFTLYDDVNFLVDSFGEHMTLNSSLRVQYRAVRDDDTFNSIITTVTIPARPNPPKPIVNYKNETVTGITKTMEYSSDGENWETVSASGSEIKFNKDGSISLSSFLDELGDPDISSVYFRIAPSSKNLASFAREIALPGIPEAPDGIYFDKMMETLVGTNATMEYIIYNDGDNPDTKTWTAFKLATPFSVSDFYDKTTGEGFNVRIRFKATSKQVASEYTEILSSIIGNRGSEPGVFLDTANECISGTNQTMEYSTNSGKTWMRCVDDLPVSGILGTTKIQMLVRISPTQDEIGSVAKVISLPARGLAPNVALDTVKQEIAGTKTTMEYSITGGVTWEDCPSDNMSYQPLATTAKRPIWIRYKATDTAVSSLINKTLLVPISTQ